VLIALAQIILPLSNCIGGMFYYHLLFDTLQELLCAESKQVRNIAGSSFRVLVEKMDTNFIGDILIDIVHELHISDMHNSRIGVSVLIKDILDLLPVDKQAECIEILKKLMKDSSPLVRKECAELASIVNQTVIRNFKTEFVYLLNIISADLEDSVRIFGLDLFLVLTTQSNSIEIQSNLAGILKRIIEDSAWRIRHVALLNFENLLEKADNNLRNDLISFYTRSLQDEEAEVRCAACSKVNHVSKATKIEVFTGQVLPLLISRVSDIDYVREALALQLPKLCVTLGKDYSHSYLLKLIKDLMSDETPSVRTEIFKDLVSLTEVFDMELVSSLILPTLHALSDDKRWRIRTQLATILTKIGEQLGLGYFEEYLQGYLGKILSDSVYTVRMQGIECLKSLAGKYGGILVEPYVMNYLNQLKTDMSYTKRLTCLSILEHMLPIINSPMIHTFLIGAIKLYVGDSVPNLRIALSKCIVRLKTNLTPQEAADIILLIQDLLNDKEADVKYFAQTALKDLL
jgi:hypothetical protein